MTGITAPGPIYDNSMRLLARQDMAELCRWLELPVQETTIQRAESLPAATHYVDLVAEIGPGHLAHVEFTRTADPFMVGRMLDYRARIMLLHPRHRITQRVVVLAGGIVADTILDPPQLVFRIGVTHLHDEDPEPLLVSPSLAPLAVLARVDDGGARVTFFRRALDVIRAVTDGFRRHDLLHTAVTLATIHLDADTIEALAKEAGMPITIDEDTVGGRSLIARGEARGEARGRAAATIELYAELLRSAFDQGPRIELLAERLAALPKASAVRIARAATSLDDLETLMHAERAAETEQDVDPA
jgi:predicted transposase YdaD